MIREVRFHHLLVKAMAGIVEVHRDFFEDYVFLRREILISNRGAQEVGEMFDRALGKFREDVRVVGGHFLAGERVVARAHLVEDAVDVFPGVFARAFEHHVLEEV